MQKQLKVVLPLMVEFEEITCFVSGCTNKNVDGEGKHLLDTSTGKIYWICKPCLESMAFGTIGSQLSRNFELSSTDDLYNLKLDPEKLTKQKEALEALLQIANKDLLDGVVGMLRIIEEIQRQSKPQEVKEEDNTDNGDDNVE